MMVVNRREVSEMSSVRAYFGHYIICLAILVDRASLVQPGLRIEYVNTILQYALA